MTSRIRMKILVACEYSGRVRDAFRAKGHDAWSCDLLPSENFSMFHYQHDVWRVIPDQRWDMMIAFPPCTHLANSGARWFKEKQSDGRQEEAVLFFTRLATLKIPKIAIENPIGIMSSRYRKPDQIIQPWMFGDPYTKSTCLWLKNLPKLIPTNVVDKGKIVVHGGKRIPEWYSNRQIARDKTFQSIANAMAEQWG